MKDRSEANGKRKNPALDLSGARRTEVLSSPERRRRTANSVLEDAERSGTDARPLMAGPRERTGGD